MPPGLANGLMQQFAEATLATELIYSFVIIVISLMIYFSTKELYELTDHKGIKYFRFSFLFFAISYFFRSFVKFLILFFNDSSLVIEVYPVLTLVSLFFLMYASSMAIFYLVLSVSWKKWNGYSKEWIFHVIAILIAFASILLRNTLFVLEIFLILFLFIAVVIYLSSKQKKKKRSYLHTIYILLFAFWILNIIDILIPNVFQTFQLLIYFTSILLRRP